MNRRGFIAGLASAFAAPAIVRVGSLMPVKVMPSPDMLELLQKRIDEAYRVTEENMRRNLYGDLVNVTRRAFVPRLKVEIYAASPMVRGLEEGWLVQ